MLINTCVTIFMGGYFCKRNLDFEWQATIFIRVSCYLTCVLTRLGSGLRYNGRCCYNNGLYCSNSIKFTYNFQHFFSHIIGSDCVTVWCWANLNCQFRVLLLAVLGFKSGPGPSSNSAIKMHLNRAPSWESAWPVLKWRLILIMRCVSWRPKRESVSIGGSHVKKDGVFSWLLFFSFSVEFRSQPRLGGIIPRIIFIHCPSKKAISLRNKSDFAPAFLFFFVVIFCQRP